MPPAAMDITSSISGLLPPYIKDGGMESKRQIEGDIVVISGNIVGYLHIDNRLGLDSPLPVFKSYSYTVDISEVSNFSGSSTNVKMTGKLPSIEGSWRSGLSLFAENPVIEGDLSSRVGIKSDILQGLSVIEGEMFRGSLMSGAVSEISKYSLFTGNISRISEISAKLSVISGNFKGIVGAKTYIGDRNLVIIRGTVTGQRHSKNEIKSRLAVIRGQMSSPIDNILAEIGNDCYVLPVIDGKMYQELKTAGEIIGDMVIIDKCSFLKIVQDESRVLKNIRGEVR